MENPTKVCRTGHESQRNVGPEIICYAPKAFISLGVTASAPSSDLILLIGTVVVCRLPADVIISKVPNFCSCCLFVFFVLAVVVAI